MTEDRETQPVIKQAVPDEGKSWAAPYGIDTCPVCRAVTPFAWRQSEPYGPIKCLCGARFGFDGGRYELLERPRVGERDVLIRADEDDYRHKVFDYADCDPDMPNPRREMMYWRVSGMPQQTGPGRVICFSDGDRIRTYGYISAVEDGRIWFSALELVDWPQPESPPTRGFTYTEIPSELHPYV